MELIRNNERGEYEEEWSKVEPETSNQTSEEHVEESADFIPAVSLLEINVDVRRSEFDPLVIDVVLTRRLAAIIDLDGLSDRLEFIGFVRMSRCSWRRCLDLEQGL